jgi:tight adherence protein C
LAAGAVLLAFAAARELADAAREQARAPLRRLLSTISSGVAKPQAVAKLAGAAVGAATALIAVPALPSRLRLVAAAVLVVAGFVAPDAVRQRQARRRRERFVAALPDALDVLAVGVASGRGIAALFGELAAASAGPLGEELGRAMAAIHCGMAPRQAIAELRRRLPGAEVSAFAAAVERSRAYGSPLAEQLHLQAVALRRDARRRIEEHAARAAPQIQLVVALVLVPSVLLVIVAAIVAHADTLLAGV